MAFRDMIDTISDSARNSMSRLRIERYRTHLTMLVAAAFIIGVGSVVHGWYVDKRERAASESLVQCMQLYASAQENNQLWPQVEAACKAGYAEHRASHMAPLFTEYRVNALLAQGKKIDALYHANNDRRLIAQTSPLYSGFEVKRCIMILDATDQELTEAEFGVSVEKARDNALQKLTQLAADTKNPQRDMALYYAGLYAWSKNDLQTAKNMWQQLCSLEGSPYAQLVQDRVQSVV
jgi:hypothetical protein